MTEDARFVKESRVSKLADRPLTAEEYEELALAYYETLPLKHFMESTQIVNFRSRPTIAQRSRALPPSTTYAS